MSDVTSLSILAEAQRRLIANPSAVDVALHSIRNDAGFARRNHPRGCAEIDRIEKELIRAVAAAPVDVIAATGRWTPEALLRAEAGAATMRDLRAEGVAEERRSNDIRLAANREQFIQTRNEGARSIASARLTAPIRERVAALRLALDAIDEKLNHRVDGDTSYLGALADFEAALQPAGIAIGLERRMTTVRLAAARALAVKEAA